MMGEQLLSLLGARKLLSGSEVNTAIPRRAQLKPDGTR